MFIHAFSTTLAQSSNPVNMDWGSIITLLLIKSASANIVWLFTARGLLHRANLEFFASIDISFLNGIE